MYMLDVGEMCRIERLLLQHPCQGSAGGDDVIADRYCSQEANQSGAMVSDEKRSSQG